MTDIACISPWHRATALFFGRARVSPGLTGGEFVKSRFDLIDFRFRAFFHIDQRFAGSSVDPDQLVELQVKGLRVAVLGALDDEHHQERHDGGSSDLMLRPPRRLVEARGWCNSVIPAVAFGGVVVGHSGWRLAATGPTACGARDPA